MAQLLKNNASGVLSVGINTTATSLTLVDGSGFPSPTGGDYCLATLIGLNANGIENAWEIVSITGRTTNTLTVVRAREGTTAVAWGVGATIQARLTAAGLPISTAVSGLGTGVATALAVNVGTAGSPVVNGGVLGTPSAGTLTNATGLPISTGVSGLGTGVATALAVNVGTAGSPVVNGGALGTPSSGTVTNLTGTASININGTVGGTTPAAVSATSLTDSGNLTFTGTGNRITGDFSNATVASRVMFQTSTANSTTWVSVLPNGTSTDSRLSVYSNSDPTNTARLTLSATSSSVAINSAIEGTGTYVPLAFATGGSERVRVDTSGNVGIGTSSPAGGGGGTILNVFGTTAASFRVSNSVDAMDLFVSGNIGYVQTATAIPMVFRINTTERMRIDSSGNVQIADDKRFCFGGISNGWSGGTAANYLYAITNGVERLRMTSGGDVTVMSAALLGYGTGSGGTVTQATSKTTSVTLNKPTGKITMNNAALTAGASVSFVLNNSLLALNDCLIINFDQSLGSLALNYSVAAASGIGSAVIVVTNRSTGSLSEAVTINFAVIKGATS